MTKIILISIILLQTINSQTKKDIEAAKSYISKSGMSKNEVIIEIDTWLGKKKKVGKLSSVVENINLPTPGKKMKVNENGNKYKVKNDNTISSLTMKKQRGNGSIKHQLIHSQVWR